MRRSRFLQSAAGREGYPGLRCPEVAFVGRSNVGKSSLINCLTGTRGLARTSSTPGRTQLINFFSIDDSLVLVDLPGYGYARVPERIRGGWAAMIEEYLQGREQLRLVVQIVDARHEPTALDRQTIAWLASLGRPSVVVATKIDKLKRSQRGGALRSIRQALEGVEVLAFSAETGEGKKELWQVLDQAVAGPGEVA